jgi:hypothetical protein
MKKYFITVFVIVVTSLNTDAATTKFFQFSGDTLNIVTVEYSDKTVDSSATIEIFYPKIVGDDNEVIKKINDFLEEEFKQSIAWYEEAASDSFNMEEYEVYYNFETGFSVTYNSKSFLSIVMDHYQYTGGAHGNYYSIGYNINLNDGNLLSLEDIVDQNSLDLLSYECEEAILNLFDANSLYDAGMFEDEINILPDQDFFITPTALVLQFDPYEIAPYAMGEIRAEISFEKISDILKPGLPFKTK